MKTSATPIPQEGRGCAARCLKTHAGAWSRKLSAGGGEVPRPARVGARASDGVRVEVGPGFGTDSRLGGFLPRSPSSRVLVMRVRGSTFLRAMIRGFEGENHRRR